MIGKTISHYKILEELGRGGMGVVYQAEDIKLKRFVALKFLPQDLTRDEEAKERFMYEAQAASALDHPNICTVYEIDETGKGQMFISMAHYEGETLKKKIERGPLKLEETTDISLQVAEGLANAHKEGIVHRDIKPANIIVTSEGSVKIVDFGLAKLAGRTRITKTETTVGTVAYMSPEQTRGEEIDHHTDIWSLGVVLYEMVTGQLPFRGDYEQAVIYSIMNEEPEPITGVRTGVPMELERITKKALAKSPDERYQHADEVSADLKNLKKGLETGRTTVPAVQMPLGRKPIWRQPFSLLAGLMAVILVLYGLQRFFKKAGEGPVTVAEKKSIAVMPFENLTGDETFDVWRKGIPELLITSLSGSRELYVLGSQTLFDVLESMGEAQTAQIIPSLARQVASKVNVETVILGNILKAGDKLRIQVKLQDAQTGKVIQSEMTDGETEDDLFDMAKTLSDQIKDYLEIKALEEDVGHNVYDVRQAFTTSAAAYRHYIEATDVFFQSDFRSAIHLLTKAVEIDSNFTAAYMFLSVAYYNTEQTKQAKKNFEIADKYKDRSPYKVQLMVQWMGAVLDKKPREEIEWAKRIVEIDPQYRPFWYAIGHGYYRIEQYNQAVEPLERAMELGFEWGRGWKWYSVYIALGRAYHELGEHDQEMEVYEKGLSVLPDHPRIIQRLAIEYLSRGDTAQANIYLRKYESKRDERGWSKARITQSLASIYVSGDDLGNAEEFYRRALDMDPKDPETLNGLAYLLIDHDINVDEGMEFINRALEIEPGGPTYLHTQGLGYHKQGKHEEAVRILENAWEENPYYDHDFYQQLQKARNALARRL